MSYTNWTYHKELTIDSTKIASNLSNFPIRVFLNSINFDFTKAESDGSDIRFTVDDTDDLDFERVFHDSVNQEALYFVKIPSVSSTVDTVFKIYYGNKAATDAEDSTSVWDSNFKAVWHKWGDESSTDFKDSTINAHHSSVLNGAFVQDGKKLGIEYGSTDEASQVTNSDDFKPDSLHLTIWINPSDLGGSSRSVVIGPISSESAGTLNWAVRYTSDGYLGFSAVAADGSWFDLTDDQAITLDQWHKLDMVIDAADTYNATLYLNNTQILSSNNLVTNLTTVQTHPLYFAGHHTSQNDNRKFPGIIGETRISDTVRSSAWMSAEKDGVEDALLTYGAEQGSYTIQVLRRTYQGHSFSSPVVRHISQDQSYYAQIVRHLSDFQEYIVQSLRRVIQYSEYVAQTVRRVLGPMTQDDIRTGKTIARFSARIILRGLIVLRDETKGILNKK